MNLQEIISQFIFREVKEADLNDWNLIYEVIEKIELDGFHLSSKKRDDKLFRCKVIDKNGEVVSIYNHSSRKLSVLFACSQLISEYYKINSERSFA